METIEVSHTREVSGASKFMSSTFANRALAIAPFTKYESALETSIMMRITKSQTRAEPALRVRDGQQDEGNQSHARNTVSFKAIGAGPDGVAALSPVPSAITPGLRASSSLILKTIFIKSAPMSQSGEDAPAILSAAAPSDSPIANPMKHGPAYSPERTAE